jgi:hypothetical protein
LFVGGGGTQQQIPKGVEGEDDEQVRFERRREKERKRDASGKRKNMKDKDWILKKKEVSQVGRKLIIPIFSLISLVVSPTRKRGGTERFKIYWPQAQANLLMASLAVFHKHQIFVKG